MFKNLTIGKKIAFGFGTVLALLVLISAWSYVGVGGIVSNASEVIDGNKLKAEITQREVDHLNWVNALTKSFMDEAETEITVQTDSHKCAFGKWYYSDERKRAEEMIPALKSVLNEIELPHQHLHTSATEINEVFSKVDADLGNFLRDMKTAHQEWNLKIANTFLDASATGLTGVQMDHRQCTFGKWLYSGERENLVAGYPASKTIFDELLKDHQELHDSAREIEEMFVENRGGAADYYSNNTQNHIRNTLSGINKIVNWHDTEVENMLRAQDIYATKTTVELEKVKSLLHRIVQITDENVMTDREMLSAAGSTQLGVTIISLVGIFLGIGLAYIIGKGILTTLNGIIKNLGLASEQVSFASSQLAQGSQQMASGASQQAGSLEEISGSLEEMAAMTRQNADNTGQADSLAKETRVSTTRGLDAMNRMNDAIHKIKSSSDETAKIVKTIDEIAFQTNLLALNAAVESARAGEAGKGFAVVADEVRSLAQRSAEAAKNTTMLIEGSRQNADNGVSVSNDVMEILKQIDLGTEKFESLINEVKAANDEQSDGIGHVNDAVAELDAVTQSTASNSEESASASEELSAQAGELNNLIQELLQIVGGSNNIQIRSIDSRGFVSENRHDSPDSVRKESHIPKAELQIARTYSINSGNGNGNGNGNRFKGKIIAPESVIPLDADELADF